MAGGFALAILAACGSGRGETIAVSEYQRRANAICARATSAANAVVQPVIEDTLAGMGDEPFASDALQQFYRTLVPPTHSAGELVDEMLVSIRALSAPDERADDYRRLWARIEVTMKDARSDVVTAAANPAAASALWEIETSPFDELDVRAVALGVHDCTLDQ